MAVQDAELDKIAPLLRAHPDVLEIRWEIYAKEKRWEACAVIALATMRADPQRATAWIHHSCSLPHLKRTEAAYNHLATVAEKFTDIWMISYNLSCCCAQLGRLDEAADWFKKAMLVDHKTVQRTGIDDPDLKPLWDSMSTTIWKKNEDGPGRSF